MTAARRDRRIIFETVTTSENAMGEAVPTWNYHTTAWAAVFTSGGQEARAAASEHASSTITVETLCTSVLRELDTTARLIHNGYIYDIKAIEEIGRRQGIRFTARTIYQRAELGAQVLQNPSFDGDGSPWIAFGQSVNLGNGSLSVGSGLGGGAQVVTVESRTYRLAVTGTGSAIAYADGTEIGSLSQASPLEFAFSAGPVELTLSKDFLPFSFTAVTLRAVL